MTKINGKQRIINVFTHLPVDRVPWVPFAGIHAGKLKNYFATELLTDENKLLESILEANRLYLPDGQPVLFDLQIEAEILGCELKWAQKAPPSVKTHPLATTDEIPDHLPAPTEGRIPLVTNVMRRFKTQVGDTTALFGLITGPLTLASHLRGTALFMDLIRNKEYTARLLTYCTEVGKKLADYYLDAGMDVIAVVDPVVSQVSPRTFKDLLHSPFTALFDYIKSKNALTAFFVCGDATKNIEPMCYTNPHAIFVDENINLAEAKIITDAHNIVLGGNIPLTSTMLYGTQQDNMKFVLNLLDSLDHKNLVIAPGCDMPYDVPPENVIGVVQAILEPESTRIALEHYEAPISDIKIDLPDYANLEKPLIEVFTLDSAQCAACGYMIGLAMTAKDEYQDRVDVVEYKWTILENMTRSKLMGVQHLPCLYINGKLKWSSLIPAKDEYFKEIEKVL